MKFDVRSCFFSILDTLLDGDCADYLDEEDGSWLLVDYNGVVSDRERGGGREGVREGGRVK